ncbi:MAG: hypothetical protein HQ581_14360 [Planctomycetes bacterium]|nr:hypothetical protein [Planctomycetota bacterium]
MNEAYEKERAILDVVDRLRSDLGDGTFDIVDHWEIDLCAIGLALPRDHRILVYISSCGHPNGEYDYEMELPPEPGTDDLYSVADRNPACDYGTLLQAIKRHWKL